ncbi:PRTRC system protein E [Burkholderia plantarii]|uniref:PRTRC system protein E n=1 Tax=Burkholderia plantarii TaxID=41899 RepID=UPI00272AA15A|nr:PRTRC system protein E [Burkholderia plantarii]WLE60259.1 PRTRC system protein E [Burkholderia plantarii]
MSLFTSLHEIARAANLNILIVAEGDDELRVNVTPVQDAKAAKKLWPLSLVATPAELDEQFANAVAAYEPGALSVLDQARACAAANSDNKTGSTPTPIAPASSTPKRRGRPPKNQNSDAGAATPAPHEDSDPRQLSIDEQKPHNPDDDIREDKDREPGSDDDLPGSDADTPADGDDGLDVY